MVWTVIIPIVLSAAVLWAGARTVKQRRSEWLMVHGGDLACVICLAIWTAYLFIVGVISCRQ